MPGLFVFNGVSFYFRTSHCEVFKTLHVMNTFDFYVTVSIFDARSDNSVKNK